MRMLQPTLKGTEHVRTNVFEARPSKVNLVAASRWQVGYLVL